MAQFIAFSLDLFLGYSRYRPFVIKPKDTAKVHQIVPSILNFHELKHVIAGGGVWPEPYAFDPEIERNNKFISYPHSNSVKTTRSLDQQNVTEALTAEEYAYKEAQFGPISTALANISSALYEQANIQRETLETTATEIAKNSYQISDEEA